MSNLDPELHAALLRLRAAAHDMAAARDRAEAAAVTATASVRTFLRAWQGACDDELAAHPDVAELNVRLDALYDTP